MNKGAAVLFVIFTLLFITLASRFITIQITGEAEGRVLASYADQKYTKERILDATRGSILDRNGELLAFNTVSYRLVAVISPKATPENSSRPYHVVDPEKTAEILARHIDMDKDAIYERLTREGPWQVEFGEAGRNLTYEEKRAIEQHQLPGIRFIRETKRSYPNGDFASHLIGFARYQDQNGNGEEEFVGELGLEKALESYLKEEDGKIEYQSDLWGYILPHKETHVTPPKDGADVYLTLDKKIQTFLEDAMNQVEQEYRPRKMMGIVADAKTGEIYAMAQRPSFDPNTREGITDNWQNIVVETAFEPGSTMKIFTLAAAVEEGVFHPDDTFPSGQYQVPDGGGTIRDHNYVGWGTITFLEGIQRSSNVAMAYLLERMGSETFRNYLDKFKFGQPTGIGLDHEASGVINFYYPRDKVSTAFGQATSTTALQLVQAMTAITNDGKMMRPQVIDKIVAEDGEILQNYEPEVAGTPISKETAQRVREILRSTVTSEFGTARRYEIEGYDVAGKTGTAQIFEPGVGKWEGRENYIFSFLGFAPYDDPKLIVYVMVQQPDLPEDESGSVPVSKIFKPVMKNSLQYLNIEPAGMQDVEISILPDLVDEPVAEALEVLEELELKPIIIGNGTRIKKMLPEAEEQLMPDEKILLVTDGEMTMPDVTGWSLRDVKKLVSVTGIRFSYEGTGYVVKQNLEPGTVLSAESTLHVELQPPLERFREQNGTNTDRDNLVEERTE